MNYDNETVSKLHRLITFLVLFYVPAWLKCNIGADATINDSSIRCAKTIGIGGWGIGGFGGWEVWGIGSLGDWKFGGLEVWGIGGLGDGVPQT